jgi:hypothetical protein
MHFRVGAYPALNRTGRYRFASSASRLLLLILSAALALTGCATKANLSPTSRIVLFCNPVGHAVDLALLGMALGVAAYGGVGVWTAGRLRDAAGHAGAGPRGGAMEGL